MKATSTQKKPSNSKGQQLIITFVLTRLSLFTKAMLPLFSAILVLLITLIPISPEIGIKGWAEVVKTKVAYELKSYYDELSSMQKESDQTK